MKQFSFLLTILALRLYGITARDIIDKMKQHEKYKTSKAIITQTITTSSGKHRSFTIKFYSDKKNLYMEYLKPARVKGVKILILNNGDEIWVYFPRTGRTRKIASHMKKERVMGSTFSYEDFSGGEFEENYKAYLLGEEKRNKKMCYKLKLVPLHSDISYGKLIAWVEKQRFILLEIDYYNKEGEKIKKLTLSDYRKTNDYLAPYKFVMEDLENKGKTVMEVKKMEYDVKLPDGIFNVGRLRK